ncbi:hypothetical protein P7C70_g4762, partial [Phenoliferia sp. Uapishka_3]
MMDKDFDKFCQSVEVYYQSPKLAKAMVHAARSALRMASPNPKDHLNNTHGMLLEFEYDASQSSRPQQAFEPKSFTVESNAEISERIKESGGSENLLLDGRRGEDSPQVMEKKAVIDTFQIYRFKERWYSFRAQLSVTPQTLACHLGSWIPKLHFFVGQEDMKIECDSILAMKRLGNDYIGITLATFAYLALESIRPGSSETHALVLLLRPNPASEFHFTLVDAQVQPHSTALAHFKASTDPWSSISAEQYFEKLDYGVDENIQPVFKPHIVLLEEQPGRPRHATLIRTGLPLPVTSVFKPLDWRMGLSVVFNGKTTVLPKAVSKPVRSSAALPLLNFSQLLNV